MRPQQPPFSPSPAPGASYRAGTERLSVMVREADQLAVEIGLGGSDLADCSAAGLAVALRGVVPDLARERERGDTMMRLTLESMADKLETAAHRCCWPRHEGNRIQPQLQRQVHALIARLRLVVWN